MGGRRKKGGSQMFTQLTEERGNSIQGHSHTGNASPEIMMDAQWLLQFSTSGGFSATKGSCPGLAARRRRSSTATPIPAFLCDMEEIGDSVQCNS